MASNSSDLDVNGLISTITDSAEGVLSSYYTSRARSSSSSGGGGSTGPAPVPRVRTNRASIGGGIGSSTLIIIALLLVGGFVFSSYIKS
jgi:hypothetical protein